MSSQTSILQLFDLKSDRSGSSALDLRATEKQIRTLALSSLAFNRKNRSLLCAGDGFGRVHVWKLTEEFFSAGPAEARMLEAFLVTEDQDDAVDEEQEEE